MLMAMKRKNPADIGGNSFSVGEGQDNNFFKFEGFQDDESEAPKKAKLNLHQGNEQSFKRISFKQKLSTNFGDHLSSEVVDDLCNLVEEKKCHYCSMPAESLVIRVLQILCAAYQNNTHDANINSINEKAPLASVDEKPPSTNGINVKLAASDKGRHHSEDKIYNGNEANNSFLNQVKAIRVPVLDTPTFLYGRDISSNTSVLSKQGPPLQAAIVNPIKVVSPEVRILKERKSKVKDLGKLADQMYNKRNANFVMTNNISPAAEDPAHRFYVSETDMRYYKVLCGLAHSQWRNLEGVMLHKTSVTYHSLGESIEPLGHVDNFFIAGYCRKLFDDSHPRKSRKHFFYPHIGLCLLSYSSTYAVDTIRKSFLGANSALKLHLADKLCFHIIHTQAKHWSVFIVDLRQKLFVFLDSLFGENDNLQIQSRRRIYPGIQRVLVSTC